MDFVIDKDPGYLYLKSFFICKKIKKIKFLGKFWSSLATKKIILSNVNTVHKALHSAKI